MVDLYVRDYERWMKEKKAKLAREWISELKSRHEFQYLDLKCHMVTDFLRSQEKKFQKAFALATELRLLPPLPCATSEFRVQLVDKPLQEGNPKEQIERICHYFDRLYHILAPPQRHIVSATDPCTTPVRTTSSFQDISFSEDFGDFNETPPSSYSSVATPESCSIFDVSSQASSRSTPGAGEEVQFTFKTISHGFPPRPIPKPPSVSFLPVTDFSALPKNRYRSCRNTSSTRPVNLAPIPVLEPEVSRHHISCEMIETDSLTAQLNDLAVRTSPIRQSFAVADAGRKRKRPLVNPVSSDLEVPQHEAGRKRCRQMVYKGNPRILELQSALAEAKDCTTVQFGNSSLPPTCPLKYVSSSYNSSLPSLPVPKVEISSRQCSAMMEPLEKLCTSLVSTFEPFDSAVTSVSKRNRLTDEIDNFCKELEGPRSIPHLSALRLRSLATRISRLARIRRELWMTYPSTTPRAYLQKRHRPQRKDPTEILRGWLTDHTTTPYPTRQEKEELSKLTGLSLREVKDWFVRARFRGTNPFCDLS